MAEQTAQADKAVCFRAPEDLRVALAEIAERQQRPVSQVIRIALEQYVRRTKR